MYGWQGEKNGRLTAALVREAGRLVETDWDTAMGRVVEHSRALLEASGPLSHAFYTSGQLMIEESYTLAAIGKAGIGLGRPRPAAAGMRGPAADQGRRTRRRPPADRHGTNLALMNALVHELIAHGWVDTAYVNAHTVGFDRPDWLTGRRRPSGRPRSAAYRPTASGPRRRSSAPAAGWCRPARWASTSRPQATAASCQSNNLHLLRGMLGRPGAGILQMNGQPSAQNNREAGAAQHCRESATGTTPSTCASWPSCGTWTRS
ncbi:hypothetical protein ACFYZB_34450 [Streptomyces sp. NPDC001852]|uniref:hypothetical protein n=1 Tax=Streptomyces sp. NPDC001852 TaxID=3364619 RepID=UPI0036A9F431